MNEPHTPLNELLTLVQRQRGLRDDLLAQQKALVQDVATVDVRPFDRVGRLMRVVATVVQLTLPSALMVACVPVPDGRDMNTECDRGQFIEDAHQIIRTL